KRPRTTQLARLTPGSAPATERCTFRRELLHAVVGVLHHVQDAAPTKCQIVGIRELTCLRAQRSPAAHQVPVDREDLDATVTRARGIEEIVRPDPQGTDGAELPGLCSLTAPGAEEVSLRVELGDASVFAELRNVPVAACILNHIADVAELPRTGSDL